MHAVPATRWITALEYLARPCSEERRRIRLGESELHVDLLEGLEPLLAGLFRAIE